MKMFVQFFSVVTLAPKTKGLIVSEAKTAIAWKGEHTLWRRKSIGKRFHPFLFLSLSSVNSGILGLEFSFFPAPLYHPKCLHNSGSRKTNSPISLGKLDKPPKRRMCMFSPGLVCWLEDGEGWGVCQVARLARMDRVYYPLIDFYHQPNQGRQISTNWRKASF